MEGERHDISWRLEGRAECGGEVERVNDELDDPAGEEVVNSNGSKAHSDDLVSGRRFKMAHRAGDNSVYLAPWIRTKFDGFALSSFSDDRISLASG